MEQRLQINKRAVEIQHVVIILCLYPVDLLKQLKRFHKRQCPPELAPLSEYNAYVLRVPGSFLIRNPSVYKYLSG